MSFGHGWQSQIGWYCHLAFEEAETLIGQFASLTYFVADTKLGKKLKYFDHWVWVFVADGLFSSITFWGSVGERRGYSNRIFKVKERETWPHFTRLCAKSWNTHASPVKWEEVPSLSSVVGMPVHLNSLLGAFAVFKTQDPDSLKRMGKCVCPYHWS